MRLLSLILHSIVFASFLCLSFVNASWTKKHMKNEHHVETFDATSFFLLHDLDHDNRWYTSLLPSQRAEFWGLGVLAWNLRWETDGRTANEVRALYGLHDPSIPSQRANEIIYSVFQLFGKSVDQNISKDEFVKLLESGGDLIDCEYDGHHGDDEWEFEIHHVEQFHADDTRDESEWDHPEDIEHFRKHEEEYHAQEQQILDPYRNIPEKFRRRTD